MAKKTKEEKLPSHPFIPQPITETLTKNYMPYAMSVIVSRAIPEIDGFKPSHRKLLFTMYKMGLLTGGRTKCANIVGQTMKLNPHGDAAIYETLVRLSEGYGALLTPFIDSKGNFGKVYSRDMAYAAARYTEAKLSSICAELFSDIDADAVDFADNYDGEMKEPVLLPATYPNVLVSANTGIAVGMASSICGFNLKEVCDTAIALIKNPDYPLLETLKAPDFATGGELIFDRAAMEEIYRTGRGSFKVRSKWRYVKESNLIEVTEIPYTTNIESIIDKLAELMKNGKVKELADVRDETDLSGLKLTLDLKRGVQPDKLMAKLEKMTPLTDSFSCNFNILIAGTPRVMGVREIFSEWTAWRVECVRRRLYFDLGKKKERLHLLKGLRTILLDIDRAIRIIRETEEDAEVVPNLMIGFGIDELQAEFIAEIKLRNINKEHILKRLAETDALEAEIARLEGLLASRDKIHGLIVEELKAVGKKYDAPRRTSIVEEREVAGYDQAEDTPDYPVHLFLTKEGYFKKITPQSLRMSGEQKYKDGDGPLLALEGSNRSEMLILTNAHQAYKAKVSEFDDTKASVLGDYLPSVLGMDKGEVPVFLCLPGAYGGSLLLVFENGKAAKIKLSGFATKLNRRRLTGAYSDKSPLAAAFHLTDDMEIALFSSAGRALLINTVALEEKTTRTTQGVAVMALKKGHTIVRAEPAAQAGFASPARYRTRTLPAAGALVKEPGANPEQQTLKEE